jgi:bis(5'-nucleosyl)-tetraphosphatase (symmetrical)
MPTYAIGDLQGCYYELQDLLDKINFDSNHDQLWFAGDLVNRGPESLKCLRFAKEINAVTVLGNHDFYLLAVANGYGTIKKQDTLDEIIESPDKEELFSWLLQQPLMHQDKDLGYVMVHAGFPPQWEVEAAASYAKEVEEVLQSDRANEFFSHMYGNKPDLWSDGLADWERIRFITNGFTRIRYCHADGRLDFAKKGTPDIDDNTLIPWYRMENRQSQGSDILFGHWASLGVAKNEDFSIESVYPLDTGCVWGRELTAMRLEDKQLFRVPSRQLVQ